MSSSSCERRDSKRERVLYKVVLTGGELMPDDEKSGVLTKAF